MQSPKYSMLVNLHMQLPKDSLFHTVTKRFYFGESLHAVTKRFYLWWIYLCSHQKILSLVNLYNHAVAKRFYAGESTHAVTWGFYHCVSSEWYRLSSQFEVGHKKLDSGSCTSLNNISLVHILFFCSKEENNMFLKYLLSCIEEPKKKNSKQFWRSNLE